MSFDCGPDLDLGVNVGVLSVGVSVPWTYTTTMIYTTQPVLNCESSDPSSSQAAVFHFTFDGRSLSQADVILIWGPATVP